MESIILLITVKLVLCKYLFNVSWQINTKSKERINAIIISSRIIKAFSSGNSAISDNKLKQPYVMPASEMIFNIVASICHLFLTPVNILSGNVLAITIRLIKLCKTIQRKIRLVNRAKTS
jgi:NADH:ubiquinone oxidoreductase subunit 3 (subunit A)